MEAFLEWLRGKGFSGEQLDGYRSYVTELDKYPSLSAALRAAEEAGMPPKRIGNLKAVAARIAEFEESQRPALPALAPVTPATLDVDIDPRDRGALERPSADETPALEPSVPLRAAAPSARTEHRPRRSGCECRERQDVYLDNDFGALASMLGGGIGIGTIILIRFLGLLGALALALGLAGLGGLVTILSICYRCQGCRLTVRDLDADETDDLRKGRGLVVLVTFGLLGGAALCGFLWWRLVTSDLRSDRSLSPTGESEQPSNEGQDTDSPTPDPR